MIDVSRVALNPRFMNAIGLEIERSSFGKYKEGIWCAKDPDSDAPTINASIQVATPKEIALLPEGERSREGIILISYDQIICADPLNKVAGDFIPNWKNSRYKVVSVDPWEDFGYYRAIATKVRASA